MKLALLLAAFVQLLAECSGPPYSRPDTMLPPVYRDETTASQTGPSMGDLGWWQIFKDPELLHLERTAVAQNQDVLVAAQRVQQAMAQLTITHSGAFPQINAVLSAPYQQTNGSISLFSPRSTFAPNGLLTLQYEVDLFDKVGSATAAARAQVLQSEYSRETVMSTVVASVATLYFQLRELDDELAISQQTLIARKKSLDLVTARLEGGIGTLQDVDQATQLVAQVEAAIPQLQSAIEATENALTILIGQNPGPVTRGLPLAQQIDLPDAPAAGLPAALIERRPDIKASEAALIAANAQIGQARALLFPQFTIGASAGAGSSQANNVGLATLLGKAATTTYGQGFVSILPQLVQQIFNAGAVRAGVGAAQAGREAALLQYVETIHQSLGDVSNSLVSYREARTSVAAQTINAKAAAESTDLANDRFEAGVTSYLEVLVSDTQSYSAELNLVQAQYLERNSLVQLYKALGGGWQEEPSAQTTGSSPRL
jgi:multidrug efflux system outer membrane protein